MSMSAEEPFRGSVNYNGYFLVVEGTGAMHCSCGRPIEKREDGNYECTGGYPIYRPSSGEVMKDKFGNMMFKILPHTQTDDRAQKKYKKKREKENEDEDEDEI